MAMEVAVVVMGVVVIMEEVATVVGITMAEVVPPPVLGVMAGLVGAGAGPTDGRTTRPTRRLPTAGFGAALRERSAACLPMGAAGAFSPRRQQTGQ